MRARRPLAVFSGLRVSPIERQLLQEDLWPILNLKEDRVMLVDLGPVGRAGK